MYFHLYGTRAVCRCRYYSGKMADEEEYEEVIEVRRRKAARQQCVRVRDSHSQRANVKKNHIYCNFPKSHC